MKLFSKSKPGAPSAAGATPTFQPIDRVNLLGLLDRIVNQGEACVVRLREPRGVWIYAFQGGGLIHAGGGAVRGARQAFDLLWEFQQGEVSVSAGVDPTLSSNLYIDKGRLVEMIRRSQGALHGPGSPYIPPDQQRPIAPVNQPWPPPGQRPAPPPPGWNPAAYPQGYRPPAQPGYPPAAPPGYPGGPPPGYPPAAPPGYPAAGPQPYPGAPAGYPAPAPYPGQPGAYPPPPGGHAPARPQPQPPQPWPGYPAQPAQGPPPQPYQPPAGAQPMAPQGPPPPAPMARPAPPRQTTPPTFSVPPMPLPKPRGTVNLAGRQAPPPPAQAASPAPAPPAGSGPVTPVDELKSLRATLVSQAPAVPAPGTVPNWNVRGPGGSVAAPPQVKGKAAKGAKAPKRPGRLRSWGRVKLITFLLWACERKYSPDDHWTVKDAFEVATLELRDQFFGAFSQSFQGPKSSKTKRDDYEGDQIASGRSRGRTRGRRR